MIRTIGYRGSGGAGQGDDPAGGDGFEGDDVTSLSTTPHRQKFSFLGRLRLAFGLSAIYTVVLLTTALMERRADAGSAGIVLMVLMAACILVSSVVSPVFLSRMMNDSLQAASQQAKRVAAGDLTRRIVVKREDELCA